MSRALTIALLALLLTAGTASAEDAQPTPLPTAPGSEALEPNDTPETATPISAGERIRATRTTGDVDLYRFTAEAGDRVFAAVITAASTSGNSRLALLGPDGTELEIDDDNGSFQANSSSIAGAEIPAAGTYHLRVDATTAGQLLPYDVVLDLQSDAPTAEVEPNGQRENAQVLGDVRFVSGTKGPNDSDLYKLALGPGDTVFLSLDLDPERDGTSVNGRLHFGEEQDGQLLSVNDLGNADTIPSEAFAHTVATAGTYFLLVDGAGAAAEQSGTYELSITVIRAVERSCRTYTLEPADGALPDLAAVTFPIDVADAATIDHVAVRLDLAHTFMDDLDATLQAPAGNQTALFSDIGSSTAGGHTRMLALFDDDAATPPLYTWLKGLGLQPERPGRLSLFVGQQSQGTWNLTFRDDGAVDVGDLARADLILCARPEEGPVETVFAAGFETGDDGFTHSGTADEWERGTPSTPAGGEDAGLERCAEGAGCFKTDLDGSYDAHSSQDLVSPPISLAGRTGPIFVSWQMWYQLESAVFDHFVVSVEEDGGANSRPLFTWAGADMVGSHGNPLVTVPFSAGWGRHRADISDYAGESIRLRFHLDSDVSVQRRGVGIDNVRVYQHAFELDVALAGSGGGYVDSTTEGIDCGSDASAHPDCSMTAGGQMTLTAHPDPDSSFAGFSGSGCSGPATTCTVTLDRALSVTATFDLLPHAPADDTSPPATAPPAPPAAAPPTAAAVVEPAISDLRLGSRCVRRSDSGRVRVPMTMRLAQFGPIVVSIDRAVGSRTRRTCPRQNRTRDYDSRFRPVTTVRPRTEVAAAAVVRRATLRLHLKPGLYRIGVRVQLENGRLSRPAHAFLRVVG